MRPLMITDTEVTLFLCGDVMTGRGIDQILPHPGDPTLHEPLVKDARGYVTLAEAVNGAIPRPVEFRYVWGDALAWLDRRQPHARIVNLETAVTRSDDWQDKGINYRMHPANLACLTAAGIDCCVLANNHVLDWGREGLRDTLHGLRDAGIATAGAGTRASDAEQPALLDLGGTRLRVFSFATQSSGVPPDWVATASQPGVFLLDDLSAHTARHLGALAQRLAAPGDLSIASIHWGGNWGYAIPPQHRRFARELLDHAFHLVHGHSSHHVQGFEVYNGKLVLYGCGDFLNDYEGIGGYEAYRSDLALMYFPGLDRTGQLRRLTLVPMQIRRFQLRQASAADTRWLRDTLNREGRGLGTHVVLNDDGTLGWNSQE